jgi:hypothetical protein
MSTPAAIHIVSPAQFDSGTAQTPGSERRAAIAPALGIASAIWGGLFTIMDDRKRSLTSSPASAKCAGAKTENLRHARRPAISFTSRLSCRIWKSTLRNWSHFDGLWCAAPQRLLSSTCRTTPGRKPDVFRRAAGRHPAVSRTSCGSKLSLETANMEQSWTRMKLSQLRLHECLGSALSWLCEERFNDR